MFDVMAFSPVFSFDHSAQLPVIYHSSPRIVHSFYESKKQTTFHDVCSCHAYDYNAVLSFQKATVFFRFQQLSGAEKSTVHQDSASAPTTEHPHPCPYIWIFGTR